jgi:hypothetical protein
MATYWVLFLLPFLGSLWPRNNSTFSKVLLWMGLVITTLILVGLREKVGGDWINYLEAYRRIEDEGLGPALRNRSIGYGLINWVSSLLGGGIYGVNLVCASVFLSGLLAFCLRQPLPCLAWLVATPYFIIVVAMGYTAQSAALGVSMLSFIFILERRYVVSIVFIAIGVMLHKSAIIGAVLLAAMFFNKETLVQVKKKVLDRNPGSRYLILAGSMILFLIILAMQGPGMYQTLEYYVLRSHWESGGGVIRVLMNTFPAIVFLIVGRRLVESDHALRFWRLVCLIALLCVPLALTYSTLADRISLYLIPLQLLVWSRVPTLFKDPVLASGVTLFIGAGYGLVLWVWLTYASHAYEWIPYYNILLP